MVFLHTASSLSSSSTNSSSSSPSDPATFLQDTIFTSERALLLILLFSFEKTFFSFDRKLVFSVNDFLVLLEVHRNAMMENMDATAIMTKKKLTDGPRRFLATRRVDGRFHPGQDQAQRQSDSLASVPLHQAIGLHRGHDPGLDPLRDQEDRERQDLAS
ncbi:hypothetical protein CFP56_024486 [Quercus suber]|uniref:Uncharacterized protein n=1 Tax=Quercus suber TaxID=58331 RepID=A0AAW0M0E5_QUESU